MRRKWDTNQVLAAAGVPVPRAVFLRARYLTDKELRKMADSLGYPLVLKPNIGSKGDGVLVNLRNWDELKAGYDYLVGEENIGVLQMETYHEGDDYRVLVLGNHVLAACRRVPAHIVGDGVHTIEQLIDVKNSIRRKNPFLSTGLIQVDAEAGRYLEEQGVSSMDTVIPDGQLLYVKRVANASAGGDVIDVTEELPQPVKDAAVRAVSTIPDAVVAGVDVLYKLGDDPNNFTIIEMNSRPQIGVNIYPSVGVGPDIPKAYIDYLFPDHPRKEDTDDSMLRFDPVRIYDFLQTGISNSVSLRPMEGHHYPHRSIVTFGPVGRGRSFSSAQVVALRRIVTKDGLAGELRVRNGNVELLIAGANKTSTRRMIEAVGERLQLPIEFERKWKGTLSIGFVVSSVLMRKVG